MIARITPRCLRGTVAAIPSKSEAHRALICAALSDAPTGLMMGESSEDIDATVRCLKAFGAEIYPTESGLHVEPIRKPPLACEADCGESGSTLRFLLPVAGALGIDARFRLRGRLPERPIAPLDRELMRGGCALSRPERDVLRICGKLRAGRYELPGDVSSQYISGLLFALPLLDGASELRVLGRRESVNYVDMTLKTLASFGVGVRQTGFGYAIPAGSRFRSPGTLRIGGDWSNAAFWLCADALLGCEVRVTGLDEASAQGDRRVAVELQRLSGQADMADWETGLASGEALLDAADIPDLVPILAATACARGQALRVINAGRLRIKESDRLSSVCGTLNALGASVTETEDGLIIHAAHASAMGSRNGGMVASESDVTPAARDSDVDSQVGSRISTVPCNTCDADLYWPDGGVPASEFVENERFTDSSAGKDACKTPPHPLLRGGEVDACGDHRIAMMAAIASCACAGEVIINGAEAVNKSYPGFWRDFTSLGGCVELL